jgi:LuxR family maltose regulon positive regulatory protein
MAAMALVFSVLAKVLIRVGKSEEAVVALEQSRRLSETMEDYVGWYEAELSLTRCQAMIQNGQFETAAELLGQAEVFVGRAKGATRLEQWLEEARVTLARPAAGAMNLTRAELRTLQFLPSHHSFRSIGEQLYLSQNTVKTQANSLYRKLGVNSRAEAVMEGRRLGLLDGGE